MGKTYKKIFYHVVFATKNRHPYLHEGIREQVFHFILNKCKRFDFQLHRIGGVEDHVHLLITIPPRIAVGDAIGRLKGSSSYFVNQELLGDDWLYWQRGYGIITLSENDLPNVKHYIENQVQHHRDHNLWDDFEEINYDE